MIRRELPLTTNASPAEPVANFRRGFSFVLAPAAAGSVLELDGAFHQGTVFVFPLFGKLLLLFLSGCSSLADGRLCSGANSPDESQ